MKATTYTITGTKGKEIELPKQFSEEIRPDLIKQAVLVIQSRKRQQYGTDPRAGIEYSAKLSRRRKAYRGGYGRSASRIPRKVMLRRGTQFIYTGAVVSGTMGGRRAHPPKGEKIFAKSLNKKERQKAIRSAIAATIDKDYLENKGIKTTENLPLIVEKLEDVNKTKEIKALLEKLNLTPELERADNKKVRAGKGTMRGRKYRKVKGPLIVVSSNDSKVYKSGRNMPGFEITEVSSLNTELLAPGAEPGRLVIWSSNSIQRLEKENLFYSKNGSIQNDKISTSN
ncbi:50S ribosomal protein L4 [Candidatus Woesearchaeota archaeon]|jgi:large subunit ribosomal protein L4e|nr:50S ribosomal protein L4 [Candidatus Woesearchaeota archaeon]MBT7238055.1 50S ribosomal protein L4 [Candidatus Woesearchaeota archaeon]